MSRIKTESIAGGGRTVLASEDKKESCINRSNLKIGLRAYCVVTSLFFVLIGILGFRHMGSFNDDIEAELLEKSKVFCMSFLGLFFGIILFFAETRLNVFFKYFGFLRLRFGRVVSYAISGYMANLLGDTYNRQCSCQDFGILIFVSLLALPAALFQLIGIFAFGGEDTMEQSETRKMNQRLLATPPRDVVMVSQTPMSSSNSYAEAKTPKELPSWMRNA